MAPTLRAGPSLKLRVCMRVGIEKRLAGLGRIGDVGAVHSGKGSDRVVFDAFGAEEVADPPAAGDEGVADNAAVAFLRECLGTHDGGGVFLGHGN